MKIKRNTLFIGLNDKDVKKQVISKNRAKKIIMGIVGDCTITDALGTYTHEDGTTVVEKSYKVEVLIFDETKDETLEYCQKIKKELNQESIALVTDYVESVLI